MTEIINFGSIRDNHIKVNTILGEVIVRLNKEQKVTGIYLMFENTEKIVPKNETEETLESAKKLISEVIKNKIEKNSLIKKQTNFTSYE
jgi:predicted DNA repair protein MutK